jgi:hypothetical protein
LNHYDVAVAVLALALLAWTVVAAAVGAGGPVPLSQSCVRGVRQRHTVAPLPGNDGV